MQDSAMGWKSRMRREGGDGKGGQAKDANRDRVSNASPVPVPSPIPSSSYIHTLKPNKTPLYLDRESPLFT